ncbi:MAG: 3-dehydroquinate synthase [Proteobacteria bacterium]|nr:3-dehydroquinate synthase [Pseudomonadota bacterium]MBU1390119.1 3-dehydroquinate synthase [Pseudomonadota bacterium]MBU1544930.1 3-dehydroquinate synthase [Pseudomonadota bacterium]MBU2429168.1 3-dehydroquinate synthase [Pseudomonadota bacterium]MBU2482611.1 3-dehydroquinate synthase [Pseudomonadota bacterium]
MKTFQVKGENRLSSIHVGERLENLKNYLPGTQVVIITDVNIKKEYGDIFPDVPVITIGTGEKIKTLETVESILKQLIDLSCDRSSFIVGIGGGIVCDITGFAASIFMRGVKFGFVSTSLLSQVDASVGGKNGVNLASFKNMVGVFNQPEFVICDIHLLKTLPKEEISNGLAEIVKHALIKDAAMFDFIEQNRENALHLDYDTIFKLVADSVDIKSRVVQQDEKEAGERRKLNFGHTIGHAIEKIERTHTSKDYGHGRAVSMGMIAAALFSREKGLLAQKDTLRISCLLKDLNLPTELDYKARDIISAAGKDKKKQGADLFYVFLESIGKARVEKISFNQMNDFIQTIFK